MLKSRSINDFFEVELEELIPQRKILFDMYLYFPANRHLLLWRRKGEVLTQEFLDRYILRGLKKIHIHHSESDEFQLYLNPQAAPSKKKEEVSAQKSPSASATPDAEAEAAAAGAAAATKKSETAAEKDQPKRTEEGKKIAQLLDSKEIDTKRKQAMVAKEARDLLKKTAEPETPKNQEKATEHARHAVQDILNHTQSTSVLTSLAFLRGHLRRNRAIL